MNIVIENRTAYDFYAMDIFGNIYELKSNIAYNDGDMSSNSQKIITYTVGDIPEVMKSNENYIQSIRFHSYPYKGYPVFIQEAQVMILFDMEDAIKYKEQYRDKYDKLFSKFNKYNQVIPGLHKQVVVLNKDKEFFTLGENKEILKIPCCDENNRIRFMERFGITTEDISSFYFIIEKTIIRQSAEAELSANSNNEENESVVFDGYVKIPKHIANAATEPIFTSNSFGIIIFSNKEAIRKFTENYKNLNEYLFKKAILAAEGKYEEKLKEIQEKNKKTYKKIVNSALVIVGTTAATAVVTNLVSMIFNKAGNMTKS